MDKQLFVNLAAFYAYMHVGITYIDKKVSIPENLIVSVSGTNGESSLTFSSEVRGKGSGFLSDWNSNWTARLLGDKISRNVRLLRAGDTDIVFILCEDNAGNKTSFKRLDNGGSAYDPLTMFETHDKVSFIDFAQCLTNCVPLRYVKNGKVLKKEVAFNEVKKASPDNRQFPDASDDLFYSPVTALLGDGRRVYVPITSPIMAHTLVTLEAYNALLHYVKWNEAAYALGTAIGSRLKFIHQCGVECKVTVTYDLEHGAVSLFTADDGNLIKFLNSNTARINYYQHLQTTAENFKDLVAEIVMSNQCVYKESNVLDLVRPTLRADDSFGSEALHTLNPQRYLTRGPRLQGQSPFERYTLYAAYYLLVNAEKPLFDSICLPVIFRKDSSSFLELLCTMMADRLVIKDDVLSICEIVNDGGYIGVKEFKNFYFISSECDKSVRIISPFKGQVILDNYTLRPEVPTIEYKDNSFRITPEWVAAAGLVTAGAAATLYAGKKVLEEINNGPQAKVAGKVADKVLSYVQTDDELINSLKTKAADLGLEKELELILSRGEGTLTGTVSTVKEIVNSEKVTDYVADQAVKKITNTVTSYVRELAGRTFL